MDELYMEQLLQDPEYMMQLEWEQAHIPSA